MHAQTLSDTLRRLATAAGLAAIPLLGAATAAEQREICVPPEDTGGACLGPADALLAFQDAARWGGYTDGCEIQAVLGEATLDGGTCCYPVQADCPVGSGGDTGLGGVPSMGCMGRPYMSDGVPLVARLERRHRRPGVRGPRLDGLDAGRRATLAHFWTGVALAEHASVAEFHRVCLELLRHGAPPSLLARAQAAIVDETRHARRCFAVASAFAGEELVPAALPLPARIELAEDLAQLAFVTARDGCVAETCSAWLYGQLLARASDPVVRGVMAGVVRDENRHAELAWATLRWALGAGGAAVRDAARAGLALPPPRSVDDGRPDDPTLAAFGWAPGAFQDAAADAAWRAVVRPLGAALLPEGSDPIH